MLRRWQARATVLVLTATGAGCPAPAPQPVAQDDPPSRVEVDAKGPVAPAVDDVAVRPEPEPEVDDPVEPMAERRPFDIPARFHKPLVFPEEFGKPPAKAKPAVGKVEPPTIASLRASDQRCPEEVRTTLFVIADGKTTERTYAEVLAGPDAIEVGDPGDSRRAIPLASVVPGAKVLELWPCTGDPVRESLPSPMHLHESGRGFGKIVPDAKARQPVVRNVAAIVVIE